MVTSQITRRKNADNSETLIKRIDKSTAPFSEINTDAMIGDIPNPVYVLRKIYPNGMMHHSAYVARTKAEFLTADFEAAFSLLAGHPDGFVKRLA